MKKGYFDLMAEISEKFHNEKEKDSLSDTGTISKNPFNLLQEGMMKVLTGKYQSPSDHFFPPIIPSNHGNVRKDGIFPVAADVLLDPLNFVPGLNLGKNIYKGFNLVKRAPTAYQKLINASFNYGRRTDDVLDVIEQRYPGEKPYIHSPLKKHSIN
jgi:hypothetical protein